MRSGEAAKTWPPLWGGHHPHTWAFLTSGHNLPPPGSGLPSRPAKVLTLHFTFASPPPLSCFSSSSLSCFSSSSSPPEALAPARPLPLPQETPSQGVEWAGHRPWAQGDPDSVLRAELQVIPEQLQPVAAKALPESCS